MLPLHHLRTVSSVLQLDILFMEDFGTTPYQLFKRFCPKPVAAASLAQVFKAITHDDREVAVKVTVATDSESVCCHFPPPPPPPPPPPYRFSTLTCVIATVGTSGL